MARKSTLMRSFTAWMFVAAAVLVAAAPGAPGAMAQQSDKPYIEVYGFIQADYIQDFNRVQPEWDATLRPSKIPTIDGLYGSDGQAIISARQSRFGVLMNFPTSNKTVFTKFEFDMFGVGDDAGQTTIRLRHAYGQWGQWLAGQTNSLFMDVNIFPNTIDYWGPAGMVFLRTPQIRWTPISGDKRSFAVAIENPSNDIDTGVLNREFDPDLVGNIQGTQKIPDFTAQYNAQQKWGHWQAAGILRQISYETANSPDNEPDGSELGWGIDLTGNYKFSKNNDLLVGVVYGEGIATYMNDGGVDLAPGGSIANPTAESVPLLGISAYLNHSWNDKFTSAFGFSQTSVDNTSLQDTDAFSTGQYASANLLYYPTKNVFIGGEALWGHREDNNGDGGDDFRTQISFHYNFSTNDIFKTNREK